jgi:hypothetical protein
MRFVVTYLFEKAATLFESLGQNHKNPDLMRSGFLMVEAIRALQPSTSSYSFTAPSVIPDTKYFCKNG